MDGALRELRRRVEAAPEDVELCAELGRALARAGDPLAPAYEAGLLCAPSTLERIAREGCPVLLVAGDGERRERVARALQASGPRSGGPFVAVQASELPETLLDDALFGHVKGVTFNPMGSVRAGALEQLEVVLFLDDIEKVWVETQRRVHRALRKRFTQRIGDHTRRPADVQLIAGSTRDLASPLARQAFDAELGALLMACVLPLAP